jgi:hypothetical protein
MPVTEVTQALGSWSITLRPDTPRSVLDAIDYYGHVAITTRRSEAAAQQDGLRRSARYVGVVRGITRADVTQPVTLSGSGMGFWLGDENDIGDVLGDGVVLTAASFATCVTDLLPQSGAVVAGTIGSVPGTLTQTFQWTSPRTAMTQMCALFTTGITAATTVEWRVNGDATLDAGPVSGLYVTTPVAALVRRNPGVDMTVRSLPGTLQNASDVMGYANGVALLAAGTSGSVAVGNAFDNAVPYKDMRGNPIVLVKMVSQSTTDPTNANVAAQNALNSIVSPAAALMLTTDEFDVRGELAAGDYVWVQDPDAGLVDLTQEVHLRGDVLNPVLLRCVELDWPVTDGMGAAYRDKNGVWTDLSDYIQFESGITNVVVGTLNGALLPSGEPIGSRPLPDSSIPGIPVFGAESTSSYLGPSDGKTKAAIQVTWSTPLNTDGSTIIDGDHYEIQYQPDIGIYGKNPSWTQLNVAGYTWNSLAGLGGSWNQLIPQAAAQWHVSTIGWGTNSVLIQELTPGILYNFQVRAVDTASPPNFGAWSATTVYQAATDTIAPPTPDAPTVAAGLVSVQVTWDCGTTSGGAFTQSADLNHAEVHVSYDPLFAPTAATKLGNVQCNIGNVTGQIPIVATFTLPTSLPVAQNVYVKIVAVDNSGNKSLPSASAGVTAALISDQYISDLSVSKLTAGTVTANLVLGSTIATAASGGRVALDGALDQFEVYDSTGTLVAAWSPSGLTLLTNPGSGTLAISPNPGTNKSPTLVFSTGFPGVSSHGTLHANTDSHVEVLILDGPTSTNDTTGSFPRLGLYSGLGSGPNLSYGQLEYWNGAPNGTEIIAPLMWNQYGVYLTQFPVGVVNGGSIIGGRSVQNDDGYNGTQPFIYHHQQVSASVSGALGVCTFTHAAFFTPSTMVISPISGFFGWSINPGFGAGGFTSTQAQFIAQALAGGVATNGTNLIFDVFLYA